MLNFKDFVLNETSIQRFIKKITEKDNNFTILSASKSDLSVQENNKRTKELEDYLKKMRETKKISWIKTTGNYFGIEKSIIIFNISKTDAMKIGEKYKQDSIVWKDNNGISEYVTTAHTSKEFDNNGKETGKAKDWKVGDIKRIFGDIIIDKNLTNLYTVLKRSKVKLEDLRKVAFPTEISDEIGDDPHATGVYSISTL